MKTFSFCPLLCVFVTLILSSSFAITSAHLAPSLCRDIAKTNPKDINYDFCVSQLQSNPLALKATAPQIGEISFNLTLSKAKEMHSLANQLLSLLCIWLTISLCSSSATATSRSPAPGPTRPTAATTNSLVLALCKDLAKDDPANVDYEFCVSQLESDPRSSISTAPQVGDISFQMSVSRANDTALFFYGFTAMPDVSDPARKVLEGCSKLYSEIVGELEAGRRAVRDGELERANAEVKTALVAAETCGREIRATEEIHFAGKMNDRFYRVASISLGFTKLLRIVN